MILFLIVLGFLISLIFLVLKIRGKWENKKLMKQLEVELKITSLNILDNQKTSDFLQKTKK